jgi:hypothetical protein
MRDDRGWLQHGSGPQGRGFDPPSAPTHQFSDQLVALPVASLYCL